MIRLKVYAIERQHMAEKRRACLYVVAQLSSRLVSPGSDRWNYAGGVSPSRGLRRRVAGQFASRNRALRLLVRWAGFLDLLRFTLHRRFSYIRDRARHRIVAW